MLPQESMNQLGIDVSTKQLGIDVSISSTQGCASLGVGLLCLPRFRIQICFACGYLPQGNRQLGEGHFWFLSVKAQCVLNPNF